MRKTLLAVAAALAIFSLGSAANHADAMPASTPSALGLTTEGSGLVRQAAIVCGGGYYGGCVRVWPRRYYYRRHYWAPRRYYWRHRYWRRY
jgi:hypothetical protein